MFYLLSSIAMASTWNTYLWHPPEGEPLVISKLDSNNSEAQLHAMCAPYSDTLMLFLKLPPGHIVHNIDKVKFHLTSNYKVEVDTSVDRNILSIKNPESIWEPLSYTSHLTVTVPRVLNENSSKTTYDFNLSGSRSILMELKSLCED